MLVHLHFLKYMLIDYFTYRRYFLSIYTSVHFHEVEHVARNLNWVRGYLTCKQEQPDIVPISVLNTYLHKFDSIYYINCQGVANNHTNILTNVQHKIYINGWRMRQTLYFFWIHTCIYSFDDRSFSCAQFYFLRIIHVSTDKIYWLHLKQS